MTLGGVVKSMKTRMKKDNKTSRYSFALIFSLLSHFLIISYVKYRPDHAAFKSEVTPPTLTSSKHAVDLSKVKFLTSNELKQIKKEQKIRQVVASESNGKKIRPVDSRFAGEQDQSFDRQTIAKMVGSFKEAGKGNKVATKATKEHKAERAASKKISLSDLGSFAMNQIEEKSIAEVKSTKVQDGIEAGKEGVVGAAANNDFVEDVALGDMTNLNTTEFKYYGFYHRIRQKLEQYWGNTIQEKAKKLYKVGRRLPASENMITAITVVLDKTGSIIDIKVDGTSGVSELDQAAIESFNKAGPFPNPPLGLIVDGRATIQWGFVVKG